MRNTSKIFKCIKLIYFIAFFSITFVAKAETMATAPVSTEASTVTSQTTASTVTQASTTTPWDWKTSGDVYDKYKWGFMGYIGLMTGAEMYRDAIFDYGGLGPGTLYTFEVDRQLPKDNLFRKVMTTALFASTVELASNITYETDPTGPLVEYNPYFIVRWRDFPWNRTILTTFGFAEGVSWASHNPQQEIDSENSPGDASKFLNYLMAELTFSLPDHPEWQVMYRLHHRSGVFGLYCPGTVGSTAAGIGVRYWAE